MQFRSTQRIRWAEIAALAACILFTAVFSGKYLILPGMVASQKAEKNAIMFEAIEKYYMEGDYLDAAENMIMSSSQPGTAGFAEYPLNFTYAWLLGYYTVNQERENKFGLRGNLAQYTILNLDENNKGKTVKLTTDTALQNTAFNLLGGNEGSIIVIDNHTGAIKAFASHSTVSYDVNNFEALINSSIPDSQYRRGTYENDPPGSTFKIVTAAAALTAREKGELSDEDLQFYDEGTFIPEGSGYAITNYNDAAYGNISLEDGFAYSVNTYFAHLGVVLGADRLEKQAKQFAIGTDIDIPYLTTLHSSFAYEDEGPLFVAQTAFGQGQTEITPVHLCMIAQAIANDGAMLKPYVVEKVYSERSTAYAGSSALLKRCVSTTVAASLKEIMHAAAEQYGLYESYYGYVCAKTGTAECPDGRIHTYLVGFTEDASFCISMNNSYHSYDLYPVAQNLVYNINNLYAR
ncbi:MAG: hypothetical protein IKD69_12805 [Solobacterium sp.]|nr:hypothetical protein [Solobacterium sp.]